MYAKANPSTFCHHYGDTRHSRLAPTTSYSDTTSTYSSRFSSPSEERRRKVTFAWAAEQEFLRSDKRGMTTEEWVKQQQDFQPKGPRTAPRIQHQPTSRKTRSKGIFTGISRGETVRVRLREVGSQGKAYVIETTASTDEEAEWERAQNNARTRIREEFKKMEDHLRRKQESEREERVAREQMARAALEEKEARDRMRVERVVRDGWRRYEQGWSVMTSSTTEQLKFESIPWPVIVQPKDDRELTKIAISGFLFSPLHSPDLTRKERLRNALLRWHPDRFTRFTSRIVEEDRERVVEAVGIIARTLNDLII